MNNEDMMESKTGEAVLEDVELDTFVAFCEFAYKGSYTTPVMVKEEEEIREAERAKEAPQNGYAYDYEPLPECTPLCKASSWGEPESKCIILSDLWELFRTLTLPPVYTAPTSFERPPALTFHAKVYVFATRYLIDPLRKLSMRYLHRELCRFPVTVKNSQEIFDLVEYTYTYTTRDEAWGLQLRELVSHYLACKVHIFVNDSRWMLLLDNYGEAGSDLVRKLIQYISPLRISYEGHFGHSSPFNPSRDFLNFLLSSMGEIGEYWRDDSQSQSPPCRCWDWMILSGNCHYAKNRSSTQPHHRQYWFI
ncbi:hypothetical protein VTN00DRAFT_5434 [Thermoascus crustaceus]|uniref:uncharacterized protein n=1 Tax=Thermoascus crustaceus TaxID=5088 RepID=UPI0037432A6A